MKLGSWTLPPFAMLAPMAGVSDRALRELAMREGAVACATWLPLRDLTGAAKAPN